MSVISCLLLADDFTGACDTGVQFSQSGLRSSVFVLPVSLPANSDLPDVFVVDTESRNVTASEAATTVEGVCAHLRGLDPLVVYKKVDSEGSSG